jgi:hypothetical protein
MAMGCLRTGHSRLASRLTDLATSINNYLGVILLLYILINDLP